MSNPEDASSISNKGQPDHPTVPGEQVAPKTPLRHDEPQQPGALRLIYEYENGEVTLVSQQRVDVAVPGFDLDDAPAGDHIEVRNADGVVLSRVAVRNAVPESIEVFGEPGEAITRMPDPVGKGAFTVVVPAPPEAARVVLHRPRLATRPVDSPAAAPGPGFGSDRPDEGPIVLSNDAIEG